MLKRFMKKISRERKTARELLDLELSEIEEISDRMFRKIEEKMEALELIEDRIDGKIEALEKLLDRVEGTGAMAASTPVLRNREICALSNKGLKIDEIAGILDMPKGEIELILNLGSEDM